MILSLVVALLQTAPASSGDARPVRVWLGSSGGLVRGASVRVYVQTTRDGNLIVLHRRTDGRIDVLFPGKPSEDVFVRAGTYEIQATSDHVAFVVAEPDGSGLVLAALAPRAYRFDEFVRAAAWNPEALAPAWNGSDGEGVLSDIVQRMLGDGYFNYDIASYSVAPPMYAAQQDTGVPLPYPVYPTCTDCTFIGYQENYYGYGSDLTCDPYYWDCFADVWYPGRPFKNDRFTAEPTRTIALAMRTPSSAPVIPRDGRVGVDARNPRPATPGSDGAPIGFRNRASPLSGGRPTVGRAPVDATVRQGGSVTPSPVSTRAVPLGPGRPIVARTPANAMLRRSVGSATPAPTVPVQVVRLSLSPTRLREEPQDVPRDAQPVALTGVAAIPPPRAAPRSGLAMSRPRSETMAASATMAPRPRAVAVAGGSGAAMSVPSAPGAAGGAGAAAAPAAREGVGGGRTMALPPAVFHGAQARMPVARMGVRRR